MDTVSTEEGLQASKKPDFSLGRFWTHGKVLKKIASKAVENKPVSLFLPPPIKTKNPGKEPIKNVDK